MLTYILSLVLLIIVLIGQIFAINGLYATMPQIDIPLHLLGGLGIGLFVAALYNSKVLNMGSKNRTVILGVLIAGLIWEAIEAYYNISGYIPGTKMYYMDTAKDLVNDMIGACFVLLLIRKMKV